MPGGVVPAACGDEFIEMGDTKGIWRQLFRLAGRARMHGR